MKPLSPFGSKTARRFAKDVKSQQQAWDACQDFYELDGVHYIVIPYLISLRIKMKYGLTTYRDTWDCILECYRTLDKPHVLVFESPTCTEKYISGCGRYIVSPLPNFARAKLEFRL